MADDVGFALDELDGSDFEAIRGHSATLRTAIATLRAERDKAVEGLERIEGELESALCAHNWSFSLGHVHEAQSLIKELRP